MSKVLSISLSVFLSISLMNCAFMNSRVLKRTQTEAIVEGGGATKAEARIIAEEIASSIFKEYEEYKEAEYNQSIRHFEGSYADGTSYIICTMYIRKKATF